MAGRLWQVNVRWVFSWRVVGDFGSGKGVVTVTRDFSGAYNRAFEEITVRIAIKGKYSVGKRRPFWK